MREAYLSDAARQALNALSAEDRWDVLALILELEENATVDHQRRFWYPRPPAILRLFDDGEWQIVYHLPDAATISILSIVRKPIT